MLMTAVVSIALSFTLGSLFGLAGVVVAPVIARILTGAWYEPWILIRDHLSGKVLPYFGLQVGAIVLWSTIAALTIALGALVPGDTLVSMAVKAALLTVVFPGVSWLVFKRTDAFQSLVRRLCILVRRAQKRSA